MSSQKVEEKEDEQGQGPWQTQGRRKQVESQSRQISAPVFKCQDQMQAPGFKGQEQRQMPSSFGFGGAKRNDDRQEHEARRTLAAKKASDAERKKISDAANLASEKAYPSLQSAPVRRNTSSTSLDFKKVAIADEEPAPKKAVGEQTIDDMLAGYLEHTVKPVKKVVQPKIQVRKPFDAEESEEMDDYEEDSDEDGEFNAHLELGRRRGDKGIW